MPNCTSKPIKLTPLKRRDVLLNFNGGSVTSDAGGLLLREADKQLNLLGPIADLFEDKRDQSKTNHTIAEMLRQRVFGIALGYEDLNDQNTLRHDIAMQTIIGTDQVLASSPTLSRFENTATKQVAFGIHKQMIESFIDSHSEAPKELVLDFDATDSLIHGEQEGRFFHGYYGNYCFLPLYVFCGKKLLVSYLRPSNIDGAKHAWAILSLLVKRFRKTWPGVRITFRGDSGFCRHKMFDWCEKNGVLYYTGLATNKALVDLVKELATKAEGAYNQSKEKQRLFTELEYGAKTWSQKRRVIAKIEYSEKGINQRFVVTNSEESSAENIYDKKYCARGDMENRIKEVQLWLFSNRTSCQKWWSNQLRMLLSALAYILIEHIRSAALVGTVLENAQVNTVRLKLFKIGAVVMRNTRSIRFMLSSYYPLQKFFRDVYIKLVPT